MQGWVGGYLNCTVNDIQKGQVTTMFVCLNPCYSHFLTIIAGVDLHLRHEFELPVCGTQDLNPGETANH